MNVIFFDNFLKTKDIYILTYVVCINVYGFFLMMRDKNYAKHNKWRIKERRFFLVAFLGGSLGTWIGMKIFRHKTKHKSFSIGIPVIFLFNILLLGWISL